MQLIAANNAQTTLAGSVSNTALLANLASGSGTLFAAPSAGQYFVGTFTDAGTGLLHEIVWVTAVTGDQITMIRAQEGTTGLNWSANDPFGNLMTAGQLETLVQVAQAQEQGYNYAVDTGAANAYLVALAPAVSTAPTAGTPVRMVAANANTGASTLNAGWGAVAVVRRDGSPLIGNEILAGKVTELFWTGSVFQYPGVAPATSAAVAAGTDTDSLITPAQLAAALGSGKVLSGQCYLQYTSATSVSLVPRNGNNVPNAGNILQLPAAGVSALNTGITLNGVPSSNLAASTTYLVALNASLQLEYWTLGTGYGPSSTAGNIGVQIITGHNDKTLVGMVATTAGGQFADANGSRFVLSWFNRQRKASKTTFTGNPSLSVAAAPAELDTSIRNSFLTWGENPTQFSNTGTVSCLTSSQNGMTGIGFDGTTPELEATVFTGMHTNSEGSATYGPTNLSGMKTGLSAGLHYATLLGATFNYAGNPAVWTGGSTPFSGAGSGSLPPNQLEVAVEG